MRIGFDARAAFLDPNRGFGRVTRSLAGELLRLLPGEVVLFVPHGSPVPQPWYPLAARIVALRRPRRGAFLFDGPAWRMTLAPHPGRCPPPADVDGAASPPGAGGRHLLRRDAVPLPVAARALARGTGLARRSAPSHGPPRCMRSRITRGPNCSRRVGVPQERVFVAHLGVGRRVPRRLHARPPPEHLLFVGGSDPHKNLDLVLEVLRSPDARRLPPLVVVGSRRRTIPAFRRRACRGASRREARPDDRTLVVSVPASARPARSVAQRGVRPARPRGDGVRVSGARRPRRRAPRGVRRGARCSSTPTIPMRGGRRCSLWHAEPGRRTALIRGRARPGSRPSPGNGPHGSWTAIYRAAIASRELAQLSLERARRGPRRPSGSRPGNPRRGPFGCESRTACGSWRATSRCGPAAVPSGTPPPESRRRGRAPRRPARPPRAARAAASPPDPRASARRPRPASPPAPGRPHPAQRNRSRPRLNRAGDHGELVEHDRVVPDARRGEHLPERPQDRQVGILGERVERQPHRDDAAGLQVRGGRARSTRGCRASSCRRRPGGWSRRG